MERQGNLSINSDNIFPIIKKWLYSDQDIFIRELISNGCDAITKLKKLAVMGDYEEVEGEEYKIEVYASAKDKTLTFVDNGLGMTEEEVDKYINQIAFSGATDFINKYKDKAGDEQIIGHFGLGFYSAFMVADKVTIETCSYKEGAKPVYWECDGGTNYTMSESDDDIRGTAITLYLNEDCLEYANEYRVKEVIQKYCAFMPYNIYFINEDKEEEEAAKKEAEKKEKDKVIEVDTTQEDELVGDAPKKDEAEEKKEDTPEEKEEERKPLNDTNPLWMRNPKDCTDEQYIDFYQHVFLDFKKPLFWIHLNMDYPFNLKGILYFPKINTQYDQLEGTIKLYNNQVFIADNIKEVIPEFLLLLKGVIDCPDLPLNVSRSALQNDGFVKKISDYITKKVADKLTGMYKNNKEDYEKYWDDLSPFIKFGCLKDIDADLADNFVGEKLTEEQTKEYTDKLSEAFKKATGNDKLVVKVESMKNENVSSVLTVSEESRRMMEMMRVYNMGGMDPNMFGAGEAETLVLNANNKLVKYILDNPEGEYKDMICNQLYDLAVLANKPLSAEKMTAFVKRSNDLLGLLI